MDLNIKMGIDRDFDSLKDKEVYYLFDRVLNVCLGIFTNEKELCAGVDYWSKKHPTRTICYEVWEVNCPAKPLQWEWAYIAPNEVDYIIYLGECGNSIPTSFWWGRNLIGVDWECNV